MNKKALCTVSKYNMLKPQDAVFVAISGGADSVALLHFLHIHSKQFAIRLFALHMNHNLRGEESLRDENFVRSLCKQLDIPLSVRSLDIASIAKTRGVSLELCARQERYRFFQSAAFAGGKIATAHTLSDSIETALLNIMRGTALRGMCGIPPVRGRIIRPLIGCVRADIIKYCEDNSLHYVTDSSNSSDDFTRNRLRHEVIPVLQRENPAFQRNMEHSLDNLRCDADYLDEIATQTLERIKLTDQLYSRAEFLRLPQAIANRVLAMLINMQGISPDRYRLERLDSIIKQGNGSTMLCAQTAFASDEESFFFGKPKAKIQQIEPEETEINFEIFPFEQRCIQILDRRVYFMGIKYEQYEKSDESTKKLLKNALDYDRIVKYVKLRQRAPADKIRLAGRGLTKSLKKLFNEEAIPVQKRQQLFVLEGQGKLLWVEGFGAAEQFAVDDSTRRVVLIKTEDIDK